MIKEIKKRKDIILNWLIALLAITIPFPDYALTSKVLILLAFFWLFFYSGINEKIFYLKKYKINFIAVTTVYLLSILGVFYTSDLNQGLHYLVLRAGLLLIPMILFSIPNNHQRFYFVLKYFSIAVVTVSLLSIFKAFYLKTNHLGDYFYHHKFSEMTNKHPTYFALFVSIAMLYFLYRIIEKKEIITNILLIVVLLITLQINANRISLVALASTSIIYLAFQIKSVFKRIIIFSLIILGVIFFFQSQNYKKRVENTTWDKHKRSDVELRILLWKLAKDDIVANHFIIGNGTGGERSTLYNRYKQNDFPSAYQRHYSAHNQYIDFGLDFGLFGAVLFLFSVFYILYRVKKNPFHLSIYLIFVIFMITEVILNRQSGILSYALWTSLVLLNINKDVE